MSDVTANKCLMRCPPFRSKEELRFLLSRIPSIQRESIVIVKKFELEILTNPHVLDLPEPEKHNSGIMSLCVSVCEHDNSKTIGATEIKFGSTTASVKISHSLPDIKEEVNNEWTETNRKVAPPRQTTLPTVPTRHQTFQRQLSHRLDLSDVPFEVCNISQRDSQSIGRIRPELYQQDVMRQWSADSGTDLLGDGSEQGASCGKLTFSLRYDHDVEGLIVKNIAGNLSVSFLQSYPKARSAICNSGYEFIAPSTRPQRTPLFDGLFYFLTALLSYRKQDPDTRLKVTAHWNYL
ncbi:hypothetical protein AVEN_273469-1 [Araneus ventricosus]|uniref:Uncharacterized protein n=1 Tax=Araneus ventricosus TaxID=182803 RepID=A0A4Y2RFB2_ARAVE|nr:hypothetical protein AVEN_273469-1 [Araneus ventricosus]